jgi:hypothetical protein
MADFSVPDEQVPAELRELTWLERQVIARVHTVVRLRLCNFAGHQGARGAIAFIPVEPAEMLAQLAPLPGEESVLLPHDPSTLCVLGVQRIDAEHDRAPCLVRFGHVMRALELLMHGDSSIGYDGHRLYGGANAPQLLSDVDALRLFSGWNNYLDSHVYVAPGVAPSYGYFGLLYYCNSIATDVIMCRAVCLGC